MSLMDVTPDTGIMRCLSSKSTHIENKFLLHFQPNFFLQYIYYINL